MPSGLGQEERIQEMNHLGWKRSQNPDANENLWERQGWLLLVLLRGLLGEFTTGLLIIPFTKLFDKAPSDLFALELNDLTFISW